MDKNDAPHWEVQIFSGERSKQCKKERRWACAFLLFGTAWQIANWKHQVPVEAEGVTRADAVRALGKATARWARQNDAEIPADAREAIEQAWQKEQNVPFLSPVVTSS